MNKLPAYLTAPFLLVPFLSAPARSAEPPKANRASTMDTFLISHWSFPKDAAGLKAFAETGFNTVIAVPEELPECRRHGWRAILAVPPEQVPAYVHDPNVWGYFVLDEPAEKNISYDSLAGKIADYHRLDPSRPAYINLDEKDDPEAFVKRLHPRVLSYDYYHWWHDEKPFFPLLEKFRRAAVAADIPLILWVEAAVTSHGPPPAGNEPRIRQSVYSALAYGAKGIEWWYWRPGLSYCTTINAELKSLGPELVKLRSTAVYHTAPLPPETHGLPDDALVRSATDSLIFGFFKDAKDHDFVLVVNRDWQKPRTAALTFAPSVADVSLFDRATGRWRELPLAAAGNSLPLRRDLAPGDGALLRLARQK